MLTKRSESNFHKLRQIIVAHSNASGNSDVATFPLAEKWHILQARRRAFILSYSASARRAGILIPNLKLREVLNLFTGKFWGFFRGH